MTGSTLYRDKVYIGENIKPIKNFCAYCVRVTQWKHTKKYRICKTCGHRVRKSS